MWLAQLRSAHTLADKMAALRVAVASGSGRALLNTPRTIKTPAVGGRMSSVFVTRDSVYHRGGINKQRGAGAPDAERKVAAAAG